MKPRNIFIIRHGESEGNVDKTIYARKPDYAVNLTAKGVEQALAAGQQIKNIIGSEKYCFYYSPYFRARQTMEHAMQALGSDNCVFKREEPRIREQEYSGKLRTLDEDVFEREIADYGKFFYRLEGGESPGDLFDRAGDFLGTLHRDFEKKDFPDNCAISGHGMFNRVLIMRWFKITIEEFETWKNPRNGEVYVMELGINNKYKLLSTIPKHESPYGWKYDLNNNLAK